MDPSRGSEGTQSLREVEAGIKPVLAL